MLNLCLALSLHLLPGDWNALHPCVLWQQAGWKVGAYYNSESNLSTFVARDIGNLELGLVTGYKGAPVAPMIRYAHPLSDELDAFVMPAVTVDGQVGIVVGLQLTWGIE